MFESKSRAIFSSIRNELIWTLPAFLFAISKYTVIRVDKKKSFVRHGGGKCLLYAHSSDKSFVFSPRNCSDFHPLCHSHWDLCWVSDRESRFSTKCENGWRKTLRPL